MIFGSYVKKIRSVVEHKIYKKKKLFETGLTLIR